MSQPNQSNIPSTETLSLSASLFLSSIESWIPTTFGSSPSNGVKSTYEKEKEFSNLLRTNHFNESNDRLGLGHPSLDAPIRTVQRNGLIGLNKKLNLEKKSQNKHEVIGKLGIENEDDEEDENESRVRSMGKKKIGKVDPFSNKLKKKRKDPFSVGINGNSKSGSTTPTPHPAIRNTDHTSEDPSTIAGPSTVKAAAIEDTQSNFHGKPVDEVNNIDDNEEHGKDKPHFAPASTSTSLSTTLTPSNLSPGESSSFPYDGPRPNVSPNKSKKGKGKRMADDEDEDQDEKNGDKEENRVKVSGTAEQNGTKLKDKVSSDPSSTPNSEMKSKTQLRREKRKRLKLSKSSTS